MIEKSTKYLENISWYNMNILAEFIQWKVNELT